MKAWETNTRGYGAHVSVYDSRGSVFFVHRGTTDRWVDAAPALRSAQPRRRASTPPFSPSQRSRQREGARRGGGHFTSFSSPLLFRLPLSSPIPWFRCTSSSWSAERYALRTRPLWFTSRAFTNQTADPVKVLERSRSADGFITIKHESIRWVISVGFRSEY